MSTGPTAGAIALIGLADGLGVTVLVAQMLGHLSAHGAFDDGLLQGSADRLELALGDRTGDQLIQQLFGVFGSAAATASDFFFLGILDPNRHDMPRNTEFLAGRCHANFPNRHAQDQYAKAAIHILDARVKYGDSRPTRETTVQAESRRTASRLGASELKSPCNLVRFAVSPRAVIENSIETLGIRFH